MRCHRYAGPDILPQAVVEGNVQTVLVLPTLIAARDQDAQFVPVGLIRKAETAPTCGNAVGPSDYAQCEAAGIFEGAVVNPDVVSAILQPQHRASCKRSQRIQTYK